MPLFQVADKKVKQVSIDLTHFKDEAALRDFFADNLEDLLGLRFLGKEFQTKDGRIDTLAIDETGSPVIIEYKWGEKDNILPQGLFYMDWLKDNKRFFDLLVGDKLGKDSKVNWDSPRLLLIAQGFDKYTLSAVRQVKNSIELIKYTPYSSEILYLETIFTSDVTSQGKERKKRINGNGLGELGVTELGQSFGVDYHLDGVSEEIKEIFYSLQDEINKWANVEERAEQKVGITYRTTKSFVRFEFGKTYIDVLLRDAQYNDPRGMVKDISSFEWGYKGRAKIKNKEEVSYVLDLIRQSYESTL